MLLENQWEYLYNCACPAFPRLVRVMATWSSSRRMIEDWLCRPWSEDSRYRLIHNLSVLWSECLCYQSPEFLFLMRLPALISCMTSLGRDLSERTSHTPRSTTVPLFLCTDSYQRLLWQTFGFKLGKVSLLSRRPPFSIPSWWGLLYSCASTSCTLCSMFVMRRRWFYLLGVWSLTSVFRSWQIFQTLSPAHGSKIPLAYRLSWSIMLSCGIRLKA
jgi:hypothetical protein